jgi:hypothetical protein
MQLNCFFYRKSPYRNIKRNTEISQLLTLNARSFLTPVCHLTRDIIVQTAKIHQDNDKCLWNTFTLTRLNSLSSARPMTYCNCSKAQWFGRSTHGSLVQPVLCVTTCPPFLLLPRRDRLGILVQEQGRCPQGSSSHT